MHRYTLVALVVLYFISDSCFAGSQPALDDSLAKINHILNTEQREKKTYFLIDGVLVSAPVDSLNRLSAEMLQLLSKYDKGSAGAYSYFIRNIYLQRIGRLNDAQDALNRAIDEAGRRQDHYLLYAFFTNLAFLQTYLGHTTEAISSFRMAKIESIILNDSYSQVVVDINISDLYYRNNFYSQSLFYLNRAQSIMASAKMKLPRLKNIIDDNISENYFRTGNIDSLEAYKQKLDHDVAVTPDLYWFRQRASYYLKLLQKNYSGAITAILQLKNDRKFDFNDNDKQNLADAYFSEGRIDSAKSITRALLGDATLNNHPEIKYHLYQMLGSIAAQEDSTAEAAVDFKNALRQAENNMNRLARVGDVSSQIKADDMRYSYIKQEEWLKRERIILIFLVVVAILVTGIFIMVYRTLRQKRYYEKLLFTAQKEELAFINSHEIRRHLSNILGIIELIRHSENAPKEYEHTEQHLFDEVKKLDDAIRTISEKLNN